LVKNQKEAKTGKEKYARIKFRFSEISKKLKWKS